MGTMTPQGPRPPELSIVIKAKLDTKQLGALLRTIRTAANMTQVELARKLGIPQQNVAQFETGARELMLSTMNKYVRALGWELTLTAKSAPGAKPARGTARSEGAFKPPARKRARSDK